jgi:hypothetical protein
VGGSYEEERVLRSLAAAEAVRRLSVRQHEAFRQGDLGAWIGTFVVEGVLELPGADPLEGHGALSRWFVGVGGGDRPEVLSTDSVVDVDGVRATQRSRLLLLDTGPAPPVMRGLLETEDDVAYERGRWYFSRRRVRRTGRVQGT